MPRILHSIDRWKLKNHLLRLYPDSAMNVEEAHIGQLCRSMLCHEDEIEMLESRLEMLEHPQHCNKILAMCETDMIAYSEPPWRMMAHDLCREMLKHKIARTQGSCVLINNAFRKQLSVHPLASVNFTNFDAVTCRLVRLFILYIEHGLEQNGEIQTNPFTNDETMQRELGVICTHVAAMTFFRAEHPVPIQSARIDIFHSQVRPKEPEMAHGVEAEQTESAEGGVRKRRRLDGDAVSSALSSSLPTPGIRYPAPPTFSPISRLSVQSHTTGKSLSNASASTGTVRPSLQTSASSSNRASIASSNQAFVSFSNRPSATSSNRTLAPKPPSHTAVQGPAPPSGPSRYYGALSHPGRNPHPHH